MRPLKRLRVEAPRVPTFGDFHPSTKWSIGVRVYHKYHVETFAPGRKRLTLVLLDEQGKKMVANVYNDQVHRLDPLLREGCTYYVSRLSVEPTRRIEHKWLAEHAYGCVFTRVTTVSEIPNMSEKTLPLFPPLMPLSEVFEFTYHNDIYVDVIGMVMFVSTVGYMQGYYNRNIPFRNVLIIVGSFKPVKLVVKDKVLTSHLTKWTRCSDDRTIIVATMLRARREQDHSLHTTCFSRVHFEPNVAVARDLRRRPHIVPKLICLDQLCELSPYLPRSTLVHIPYTILRSIYHQLYGASLMASEPGEPSPRQSPLISLAHASPSARQNRADTTPRSHTFEPGYYSSSGSQHDEGYEVDRRTGEKQLRSTRRSGPLDYSASRKVKFVEGSSSASHGAGSLQRFALSRSGPLSYNKIFHKKSTRPICLPSYNASMNM